MASQAPPPIQYQPPPNAYIGAPANSGQWTTGLCGCFEDLGSCCLAYWLPCLPFGEIAHILDRGGTSCTSAGCTFCLMGCIGMTCVYTCGYRAKLRQKYGLPEDPCNDCCVDYCCLCCSIAQEYRELKNRGIQPSLGFQNVQHIYDQPPPVHQMHY